MDLKKIRILIIEDTRSTAAALATVLSDFDVQIARNGEQALKLERSHRPDVITMDINLPDTDGLTLTRSILKRRSVPIVIISSLVAPDQQQLIFECLEAGAYDVVAKSKYFSAEGVTEKARRLVFLVKAAALRHRDQQDERPIFPPRPAALKVQPKRGAAPVLPTVTVPLTTQPRPAGAPPSASPALSLLAIGASTGGPSAIKSILAALPADLPLAVMVAQHMSIGFMEGFAKWLNTQVALEVLIAEDNQPIQSGRVYIPPSGKNIALGPGAKRVRLHDPLDNCPVPSVEYFFDSVVKYAGAAALYLLLTGMGADGSLAMAQAKRVHACTAVQDEESCVVFGMPKEALKQCPEHDVRPLGGMAEWILDKV